MTLGGDKEMLKEFKGYLIVALAACIFGFQATLNKIFIISGVDSLVLAIVKMSFVVLCILIYLSIRMPGKLRIAKADILYFIVYGVITIGFFNIFYMKALEKTNAITTTILLYTAPIFVIIISAIFLQEKLTFVKAFAVGMTFIGCFLVAGGSSLIGLTLDLGGILAGLGAGLCYSLWILMGKVLLNKYSNWTIVLYGNIIGLLCLFFVRSPMQVLDARLEGKMVVYMCILAFFTMFLAHNIYYYGLKFIDSGKASIISNLEPVISFLAATLILNEKMAFIKFMGFILIMVAIFTVSLEDLNKFKEINENKLISQ